MKPLVFKTFVGIFISFLLALTQIRCAQIGMPTGGDKDTIPPQLVRANPDEFATDVRTQKIVFQFSEYVELAEVQNNLLVSPLPKSQPQVDYKLRTVTIRLKDSLLPNTTYTFKFGNAIRDINESNPLRDFYYVFSTGPVIDSLTLAGSILSAETGKPDSTIMALLYRNATDSAVLKNRPDYMARVNGQGEFLFENLPAGNYKVYALKDGDGGKTYNSPVELFGFLGTDVVPGPAQEPVNIYYYQREKEKKNEPPPKLEKKLRYNVNLVQGKQDLLGDLIVNFNNPLRQPDASRLIFTDTNYKPISGARLSMDSTGRQLTIAYNWKEDQQFKLIIPKEAFTDTLGNQLTKTDTIGFKTAAEREYGSVLLRFTNLKLEQHPVLQFVQNDQVKFSYPLTATEWSRKLFTSGEYELRILYDQNQNGTWTPGNYTTQQQPERAIAIPARFSVRAGWENEKEVRL